MKYTVFQLCLLSLVLSLDAAEFGSAIFTCFYRVFIYMDKISLSRLLFRFEQSQLS